MTRILSAITEILAAGRAADPELEASAVGMVMSGRQTVILLKGAVETDAELSIVVIGAVRKSY